MQEEHQTKIENDQDLIERSRSAMDVTEVNAINEFRFRHYQALVSSGNHIPQRELIVTLKVTVQPHATQDPIATWASFFQNALLRLAKGDSRIAQRRFRPAIEIVKVSATKETTR